MSSLRAERSGRTSYLCDIGHHHECLLDRCTCGCHAEDDDA